MSTLSRTRLAILGTISDLHHEPLVYDLAHLRKLVSDLNPDLLCTEVTRKAWEGGDLSTTALEVREALALAVAASDIVLVPIAPDAKRFADFTPRVGSRRGLVLALDHLLRWGVRKANRPDAINGMTFGAFCHTICWLTEASWSIEDRAAWDVQNQLITQQIVQAAQNDPGGRMLVAVQCQRLHRLIPLLRAHRDIFEIVRYQEL